MVTEATTNYENDLQTNLGINAEESRNVANKVVPPAMNELANKAADPADNGFNIQDIFNKLSGGKTSGLNVQAMLTKLGDKDGDGDVDLKDLQAMFSGSGGLAGKVKGMFG